VFRDLYFFFDADALSGAVLLFVELKVRGDKKQLRPLCIIVPEKHLVVLCGAVEKGGKIPRGDLQKASGLAAALERGEGHVEDYFED
jgi:hypothetical protein